MTRRMIMYLILSFLIYILTGLLTWCALSCLGKHLTIGALDKFFLKLFGKLGDETSQNEEDSSTEQKYVQWCMKTERYLIEDRLRYLPYAFFYPYGENYVRIGAMGIWNVSIVSFVLLLGPPFMTEGFYIKGILQTGGNAFVLVLLIFFFKGMKLSGEWIEKGMFLGIVRFYAYAVMLPLTQAFPFSIVLGVKTIRRISNSRNSKAW